eukprot:4269277-Pyramimonas_sp.AAC.1
MVGNGWIESGWPERLTCDLKVASMPAEAESQASQTGFCAMAWERSLHIREAVYNMPFVDMLAAGTLPKDVFQHYMLQDSGYLVQYARALNTAASKATKTEDQIFLAHSGAKAVAVEGALHKGFLEKFGVKESERALPSPTNAGYVNFLLATAHIKPFEVGIPVFAKMTLSWCVSVRCAFSADGAPVDGP